MSDSTIEHLCREVRLMRESVDKHTAAVTSFAEALSFVTDRQLDHESRLSALERHVYGNSAANGAGE